MTSLKKEIERYMKELLHDPNGTFTYDIPLITDNIISMINKELEVLAFKEFQNYGKDIQDVFNKSIEAPRVNYGIQYLKALNDVRDLFK